MDNAELIELTAEELDTVAGGMDAYPGPLGVVFA